MRVSDITLSFRDETCDFRATIWSDARKKPLVLWYRFPAELAPSISHANGNALIAALLLPAMRHGERLELAVPLSPKLANSIKKIQAIYHAWEPTLSIIEVVAPLRKNEPSAGKEIGLFFSSGIDSFYSLTKNTTDHFLNEDVITQLIAVHGLDAWLENDKRGIFERMLVNTRNIGHQLGKHVTSIETNLKYVMSDLGCPSGLRHGAALASVGLFLEPVLAKLYVASGITYADPIPDANHPILDPLWSTESLSFVHDGCEATRLEKTRFISQFPYALGAVRVCWDKDSLEFNCGRCSKCLRTMLELHVVGALGRCPTLPGTIDIGLLRRFPFLDFYDEFYFFPELLDALERSNTEADAAIRAALLEGIAARRGYFDLLKKARRAIDRLIPPQEKFILVDQDTIRSKLGDGRKIIPFMERNGEFFGNPSDDETAVKELERLRARGAKFIVFWHDDFWLLDYYRGLDQHLRLNYRPVLEEDSVVVFALADATETGRRAASEAQNGRTVEPI